MPKIYLQKIYYLVIPLLIVGISYRFTTFPIAFLALLPLFFLTTRHTVGFFLLMYGGPLGGVIRFMYPFLPVYGVLLEFLGLFLLRDLVQELLKSHKRCLMGMVIVLLFFGFFYLIGPRDDFSSQKYMSMCIHGVMMVFGYYAFDKSSRIDAEGLSKILLLSSLCMFAHVISAEAMTPGSLTDFDWFREQYLYSNWRNSGESISVVGYQHIGMLILFSVAIYISQKELKPWKFFFYVACAVLLTLVSGCRQAVAGVIVVVILRLVLFNKHIVEKGKIGSIIIWIPVVLAILYYVITLVFANVGSEKMSNTIENGDSARELLWLQALAIFLERPIIGAGIGGYHAITDVVYPHNFILELLAETGLVGFIVSVVLLVMPLFRKGEGLLRITNSNQFYFLVVVGILIRVMISSDLKESIELYSAVFAITATKTQFLEHSKQVL